ncbi:D-aminoacylase [Sphingomonas koreensis]|uniref:N-acyl-D-amino-acid deacylase family protein n=1 Tax=Sphingomonas koreensis TaxID=93064 RepID=UPI000831D7FD|nr:amidohydrolase family protein [Sphingomonas koreensis]PJI88376.1 N-acyl-D-aspartate/D-glutamate deacylase [Sphingomonas koreensis]RSU58696.1 D-aminoacylase [Sphingomonas koreensis]RSU66862.1 D-aminoacylase [Sphingomonas koreensis]
MRKALLLSAMAVLPGAMAAPAPVPEPTGPQATVIAGGTLYDGSSARPVLGDVVVIGDAIVAVGPGAGKRYPGAKVIDAKGMVVAPGFIDPHTHADAFIWGKTPQERLVEPWLMQGVTTIFSGVDGYGQGPGTAKALLDHVDGSGVGLNVATFVGFGAVRVKVLKNDDREPTAAELDEMKALTAQGMCEGAFGLSSGLFYAPQSFSKTPEVIALAREAATRGGIYDTHQRDESSYSIGLMNSVAEAIEIGRAAGLPVHFAHIKALGADVHGKAGEIVAAVEAARAKGQNVTADQYPYEASGSSLVASLVPRWAQDGGATALVRRLETPAERARIVAEMAPNLVRRGGPNAVLLRGEGQPWAGKRLDTVAADWKVDPIEAAVRIILADQGRGSPIVSFNMVESDIKLLMQQPWVMTGSDGSSGHPRMYGTFPTKYAKYVIAEKTIDLATFINSSTGRAADFYKLDRRGYLKKGYFADIVVFDPKTYRPRATYLEPALTAEGVRTLIVNGTAVVEGGKLTGKAGGKAIRHRAIPGTCPR